MDTKNSTPESISLPSSMSTAFAILLIITELVNIAGNLLVLVILAGNRRLRTCTNFFIANLSISDLLAGILLMPALIHTLLVRNWANFSTLCEMFAFFDSIYSITTSLTIASIATDRYHSIVNCLRYEVIVTPRKTAFVILWIWLQAIVFSICPFLGWGKFSLYPYKNHCSWHLPDKNELFYTKTAICVLLPSAITLFCYTRIHVVARRHARTIVHIQISDTGNRIRGVPSRKTKMVYLVVGVYVICWIPLHTLKIITQMTTSAPKTIEKFAAVATVLSLINSSCNPIMYALITSQFRSGMSHLYRRLKRVVSSQSRKDEQQKCAKRDSRSSCTISRTPGSLKRYFTSQEVMKLKPAVLSTNTKPVVKAEPELRGVGPRNCSIYPRTLEIPNERWQQNSYDRELAEGVKRNGWVAQEQAK